MYADSLNVAHSVCRVAGRPQAVCLLNVTLLGLSARGVIVGNKYIDGKICLTVLKALDCM